MSLGEPFQEKIFLKFFLYLAVLDSILEPDWLFLLFRLHIGLYQQCEIFRSFM